MIDCNCLVVVLCIWISFYKALLHVLRERKNMHDVLHYIERLRPIDDIFFEKLVEDETVCEEILRVILNNPELQVTSMTPQKSIKNLWGRSVRLDLLCKLSNGILCNLEVQKTDCEDHVRRMRYHEACITSNNTRTGTQFEAVPNVIMIYISDFDLYKKARSIYHCRTTVDETNQEVENGLTEIYVNTKVDDGTEISELMRCFLQTDVKNENFPRLSARVNYLKNCDEGRKVMCAIVEEYANIKVAREVVNAIENAVKNFHLSLEEACAGLAYSVEDYENAKKLLES